MTIPREDRNPHRRYCHHDPTTIKSKKRPATKTPPPTSPHKLDQIAIFDFVAEVADIHPVLPLAVFGELDRFFVWRIYWPTERARKCFRLLAIAVA
jgi:hypothetical protein